MTPLVPPDTMLVAASLPVPDDFSLRVFACFAIAGISVLGILFAARLRIGAPLPRWAGWSPEIHPEDRAFCHRCGGHFTPGEMYDAHMRACR